MGRADDVPVLHMLTLTPERIDERARAVAGALERAGWSTAIIEGTSTVGGGSAPGSQLPTRLLRLGRHGLTAENIEQQLRAHEPPVVARIQDGAVVLDLRTVRPDEDAILGSLTPKAQSLKPKA